MRFFYLSHKNRSINDFFSEGKTLGIDPRHLLVRNTSIIPMMIQEQNEIGFEPPRNNEIIQKLTTFVSLGLLLLLLTSFMAYFSGGKF